MTNFLYQLSLDVQNEYASAFAEGIEPFLDSILWSAGEETLIARVLGFSDNAPDVAMINLAVRYTTEAIGIDKPEVKLFKIPARNWVLDNIKQFPPIEAGRFFIHGSEYNEPAPNALVDLCIPAATAFGTGNHGSTKGCLLALDKLDYAFKSRLINSALDMGCGSGILAIGIARRWHIPVIATDIDLISTKICSINTKNNGVLKYVRCLCGEGFKHREIIKRRFDIIVSNILLRPLALLAKELSYHLNPGGWAVLSGLLVGDANKIISAYSWQGLQLIHRISIGGWQTLILRKPIGKK